MVSLKKVLLLLTVILFTANPFRSAAEVAPSTGEVSSPEEINAHIQHHLKDDYYFNFATNSKTGHSYGFPLPVILIDNGLKIFSAAEFDHGKKVVEKDGNYYKLYHSKIYKTDAAGTITYDDHQHPTNAKPLDFSITKNVVGLMLAALLLFIGFMSLAKTYKNGANAIPKGVGRVLEPLVLYVRDEMAVPNIGHRYKEF